MKPIKYFAAFLNLLLISQTFVLAQEKRPVFIGLQPSFTRETFYEEGEFDINIVPLMVQVPIDKMVDIRFTSEVNYHFGSTNCISERLANSFKKI